MLGLAVQAHHGKHRHAITKLLRVEVGVIALDEAGLLQGAHAPQAGRRRDAHALRQLHVGHPPVSLQVGQDLAVDEVELHALHGNNLIV